MKKILSILFLLFISNGAYGQTFSQIFVDRCTGKVQSVTANFQTGSAIVSFYDEVKTFTYQQYINGELQQWLTQKYAWWQALSPCSTAQAQATQAQQIASTASTAASSATNTSTNATSSTNTSTGTSSGSTAEGTNTDTSSSSESTSSESSSSSNGEESSGSEEGSSESSESESENSETESESEESTEESSEEESEGGEDDGEDSDDGEESDKKKKKQKMMPIQLKADLLAQQSLLGTYNSVLNIGASQSSIFGDVNYTGSLQIFDNLKQANIALGRTKVTLDENYQPSWIDGINISYMRMYKMNAVSFSLTRMKPLGKYGTLGVGINYAYMFGKDNEGTSLPDVKSLGYNFLYANSLRLSNKITYMPAMIVAQSPLSYISSNEGAEGFGSVSRDLIGILANSFNAQLTRVFSFNVGWTLIYSSNEFIPIMNSFMIGSKIPF